MHSRLTFEPLNIVMTFEPFYVNLAHAHKAVGRSYINIYILYKYINISVPDVRLGGLAPAHPIIILERKRKLESSDI